MESSSEWVSNQHQAMLAAKICFSPDCLLWIYPQSVDACYVLLATWCGSIPDIDLRNPLWRFQAAPTCTSIWQNHSPRVKTRRHMAQLSAQQITPCGYHPRLDWTPQGPGPPLWRCPSLHQGFLPWPAAMVACPQDVVEVNVFQIIVCNIQELVTLRSCIRRKTDFELAARRVKKEKRLC